MLEIKDAESEALRIPHRPLSRVSQVSDVTANGCHLSWKEPEDDGGTPISHYEIEKLDPNTGTGTTLNTASCFPQRYITVI